MLFALQRVLGRLKRAEQSRNRGNTMKYQQSRSWLVSCIVHYNGNRPGEQDRLQRLIDELFQGTSDDEDSPTHGAPAEVRQFRISAASEKLHHHLRLLEMDLSETTVEIHKLLGDATEKERMAGTSPSESVSETESRKLRRYQDAEQGEVSDPDLWADLHYGPPMEVDEETQDDNRTMEF